MSANPLFRRFGAWSALACGLAILAGCGQRNAYVPPPPSEVTVAVAVQKPVTEYVDFTGTTRASEEVKVRSRVQGYLYDIHFQDGGDVRQGDLLFTIDQRPYQAKYDQAKADVDSRKAFAGRAKSIYARTQKLLSTGASTKEDVDKEKGDWEVALADVAVADAKMREAKLNLDFTEVRAPISGHIGRREVDIGNLITADNTILTTIAQYNPMYVYFTVSEQDHLNYLKRVREHTPGTLEEFSKQPPPALAAGAVALPAFNPWGKLSALGVVKLLSPRYPVEMGLANEKGYPHRGVIDFADVTVDPGTGTLLLRGIFDNPQPYYLAPGLFARVRVPISSSAKALLVPERALSADQQGRYLLLVNKEDVVVRQSVQVGSQVENMRVITEGLKPGERFVVDGLQRARPDAKVKPTMAK